MAELAGLIGRREARISRGPFPRNMPGARVRPESSHVPKPSKAQPAPRLTLTGRVWCSFWNSDGTEGGGCRASSLSSRPPSCEGNDLGQNRPPRNHPRVARGQQPCPSIVGSIGILDTARSGGFFRKIQRIFAGGTVRWISAVRKTRRLTRLKLAQAKSQ